MAFSVSIHRSFLVILVLLQAFSFAQETVSGSYISSSTTDPSFPTTTASSATSSPDTGTLTDSSVSTTPIDSGILTSTTDTVATITNTDLLTTTLPTSTTLDNPLTSSTSSVLPSASSKGSHAGAIAGGVIGGLAGLGVIAALLVLFSRRGFSGSRRRSRMSGGSHPPSPRLKSPWLSGVSKIPRAQRLGSVGDVSARTSPPRSNQGHGPAHSDDAHELGATGYSSHDASASTTGGAADVTSTGWRQSSTSIPEDSRPNGRSSHDINASKGGASVQPRNGPRESDPFGSETSITGQTSSTTPAPSGDLARRPSGSRPTRKPAPKYDESEPSTPVTPRQSKPPVSRPPRTRTYSNSSSLRAQTGAGTLAGGSSRSSLEGANLAHKSSQSTLGGAFKFAGEKDGPVHYLIPDAPPSAMQ